MNHPKLLFALCFLAIPMTSERAATASTPATWDELRHLSKDCPVVYDNDWLKDTNDDEYLLAKAHLGQANLRGLILSKDEWDHGRQYKVEDGRKARSARIGRRPAQSGATGLDVLHLGS